jgi:hypothetical protein
MVIPRLVRPLVPAIVVLLALSAGIFVVAHMSSPAGWAYAVDDAYIHLSAARTLHEHGVWGLTPQEFTTSTSSPLWVLMLGAVFLVTGSNVWVPLVVNAIASVALIWIWCRHVRARRETLSRPSRVALTIGAVVMVLFAYLPRLLMQGMEHIVQGAFTLLVAGGLVRVITAGDATTADGPASGRSWRALAELGAVVALASLLRYENLFIVGTGCAVLLVRRRLREALAIGGAAVASVSLAGAWFVSQGGTFLPTPLMLKSRVGPSTSALDALVRIADNVAAQHRQPLLLVVIAFTAWFALRHPKRRLDDPLRVEVLLFAGTTALQIVFARVSSIRYQAYLLVWLSAIVCRQLIDVFEADAQPEDEQPEDEQPEDERPSKVQRRAAWAMVGAALLLFGIRGALVSFRTPRAMINIHDQQRQMARFIRQNYEHDAVALNDIGTTSWFVPSARVIDLYGLGTPAVAEEKLHGQTLSAEFLDSFVRENDVQVAILYKTWFRKTGVLDRWQEVGSWTIEDRSSVARVTVEFYALDETGAERLRHQLKDFRSELPETVDVDLR